MQDWELEQKAKIIKEAGTIGTETKRLIEAYHADIKNGIAPENSDARTLILLINDNLIYRVLHDMKVVDVGNSEEYMIGKIALVNALDGYKLDGGAKFSTYACQAIKNAILLHHSSLATQRRGGKGATTLSLDSFGTDEDGENIPLTVADECDIQGDIIRKETFLEIIFFCGYLTESEQEILMMYYGLGKSKPLKIHEIAAYKGISKQRVGQLLQSGIKKIQLQASPQGLSDKDNQSLKRLRKTPYFLIPELKCYEQTITTGTI